MEAQAATENAQKLATESAIANLDERIVALRRELETSIDERVAERIDERVASAIRDELDQETRRQRAKREEKLAAKVTETVLAELKSRIDTVVSENAKVAKREQAALEELARTLDKQAEAAVTEMEGRVTESLSQRLAARLGRAVRSDVEKRVSDASAKIAIQQERSTRQALEGISRSVRDEFETRLRALEQRTSEGRGWRR